MDPWSSTHGGGLLAAAVLLPFVGAVLFAFVIWVCTWPLYAEKLLPQPQVPLALGFLALTMDRGLWLNLGSKSLLRWLLLPLTTGLLAMGKTPQVAPAASASSKPSTTWRTRFW